MALNLMRSGAPLVVWNRAMEKAQRLRQAGTDAAADVAELFGRTQTVILMLSTGEAIDAGLGRGKAGFASLVAGHLVVNMGTTVPLFSRDLDRGLRSAGARCVEAPVRGGEGVESPAAEDFTSMMRAFEQKPTLQEA